MSLPSGRDTIHQVPERLIQRHTDRQTVTEMEIEAERQTDRDRDRQMETHRQTETERWR